MELKWQVRAWEDYLYWQQQDKKILQRINDLIKDTLRSPFKGIGKPEPLGENYQVFGAAESMTSIGWLMVLRIK